MFCSNLYVNHTTAIYPDWYLHFWGDDAKCLTGKHLSVTSVNVKYVGQYFFCKIKTVMKKKGFLLHTNLYNSVFSLLPVFSKGCYYTDALTHVHLCSDF